MTIMNCRLEAYNPMGKAMLTIMSAFAQLERDTLAERTRTGMAVAAANGRKAGRRQVVADDENVAKAEGEGLPRQGQQRG